MKAVIALLFFTSSALAQVQVYENFFMQVRLPDIVAGPVSQNQALNNTTATLAEVCNRGVEDAFVAFGGVSVVADPNLSEYVGAGTCVHISVSGTTNEAVITTDVFGLGTLITTMLGTGNP